MGNAAPVHNGALVELLGIATAQPRERSRERKIKQRSDSRLTGNCRWKAFRGTIDFTTIRLSSWVPLEEKKQSQSARDCYT